MRPSCGRRRGDVEPAHDLEPVGDGAVDSLGNPVDGVEDSVDAHADDRLLAPRLDVDVARPLLEGVVEQVLHRRHHRLARGLERLESGQVDELLQVADVGDRPGDARPDLRLGLADLFAKPVDLGDGPVDIGRRREHRIDGHAREAVQVLEELPVEGVRRRHHEGTVAPLERQDRVLAGEGARERAGDELGVELEGIDLPVDDAHGLGHRLGRLVLVEDLSLAAGIGKLERREQLDGRQVGAPQRAAPAAGLLAQQLGALDVFPRDGSAPVVVAQHPLPLEDLGDELQGEIACAVASHWGAPILSRVALHRERAPLLMWSGDLHPRDRAGEKPQPTGPQPGPGRPASPPPGAGAAGRDITFATRRPRQPGHVTSSSSARRRTISSKTLPQPLQAYS